MFAGWFFRPTREFVEWGRPYIFLELHGERLWNLSLIWRLNITGEGLGRPITNFDIYYALMATPTACDTMHQATVYINTHLADISEDLHVTLAFAVELSPGA